MQKVYVQYVPYFYPTSPGRGVIVFFNSFLLLRSARFSFLEHSGVLNSNQLNRLLPPFFSHKHKALVTKDTNAFLLITSTTVLFVSSVPAEQSF
jgi:hypothetical protein